MFKFIKRKGKRLVRKLIGLTPAKRRNLLISYVIALLPANYVTTAITTGSNLINPTQVMQVMKDTKALSSVSGLVNTATGGLLNPVLSMASSAVGHATSAIGHVTNVDGIKSFGKSLVDGANGWFNAGQVALNHLANDAKKESSHANTTSKSKANDGSTKSVNVYDAKTQWSPKDAPEFYKLTPSNSHMSIEEAEKLKAGEFYYSELDELGRTRYAQAAITLADVEKSAGTRESFEKGSDPSGWGHNEKISIPLDAKGKVYNGYAFNRSHLIADSLGGRAFRNNLITGTRMQNVGKNDLKGGMQYFERKIINYLKYRPNVVAYYRVTPIYVGDELVPRTIEIDLITSDYYQDGYNEHGIVYNVLPGYEINYKTGEVFKLQK